MHTQIYFEVLSLYLRFDKISQVFTLYLFNRKNGEKKSQKIHHVRKNDDTNNPCRQMLGILTHVTACHGS